jgi:DNA mismatch repair protein MutS2
LFISAAKCYNHVNMARKAYQPRVPLTNELRLRRLTLDEALPKLDQYLHDAFVSGMLQVRIIHGKGTGTMRTTVRRELKKHPLVKSFRPGEYGEGGEGVTIVEMADR